MAFLATLFIFLLIALAATAYIIGLMGISGHAKWPIDYKYTLEAEYLGERNKGRSFYSHDYRLTVTDNATGETLTEDRSRYPSIYKDQRSWARLQAREIYEALRSENFADSFKLT